MLKSRPKRCNQSQEDKAKSFIRAQEDPTDFLHVKVDDEIGFAVFSKRDIVQGEFLMEYRGEKISCDEADKRSCSYGRDGIGSFIFHEVKDLHGKKFCIDATHTPSIGRFVNDSPDHLANARMKRIVVDSDVHLCLFSKGNIEKDTEIRYDYFDEEENMPWRKKEWLWEPLSLSIVKEIQEANSEEILPFLPKICDGNAEYSQSDEIQIQYEAEPDDHWGPLDAKMTLFRGRIPSQEIKIKEEASIKTFSDQSHPIDIKKNTSVFSSIQSVVVDNKEKISIQPPLDQKLLKSEQHRKESIDFVVESKAEISQKIPKMFTMAEFTDLKYIGEGKFATVYMCKNKNNEIFAIRKLQLTENAAYSSRKYKKESFVLSDIMHPNVIRCFGVFSDARAFLLEYCFSSVNDGFETTIIHSLKGLISTLEDDIPIKTKMDVFIDVSSGLHYLHSQGIVVGDLKPSNILIQKNVFKIADFSVETLKRHKDVMFSTTVSCNRKLDYTIYYLAPELLSFASSNADKNSKTDMYSFSMLGYEVLFPSIDFKTHTTEIMHLNALKNHWRPKIHSQQDMDLKKLADIVTKCWSENPNQRLSAASVHKSVISIRKSYEIGKNENQHTENNKKYLCTTYLDQSCEIDKNENECVEKIVKQHIDNTSSDKSCAFEKDRSSNIDNQEPNINTFSDESCEIDKNENECVEKIVKQHNDNTSSDKSCAFEKDGSSNIDDREPNINTFSDESREIDKNENECVDKIVKQHIDNTSSDKSREIDKNENECVEKIVKQHNDNTSSDQSCAFEKDGSSNIDDREPNINTFSDESREIDKNENECGEKIVKQYIDNPSSDKSCAFEKDGNSNIDDREPHINTFSDESREIDKNENECVDKIVKQHIDNTSSDKSCAFEKDGNSNIDDREPNTNTFFDESREINKNENECVEKIVKQHIDNTSSDKSREINKIENECVEKVVKQHIDNTSSDKSCAFENDGSSNINDREPNINTFSDESCALENAIPNINYGDPNINTYSDESFEIGKNENRHIEKSKNYHCKKSLYQSRAFEKNENADSNVSQDQSCEIPEDENQHIEASQDQTKKKDIKELPSNENFSIRPYRPCLYCKNLDLQSSLKKHLKRAHKEISRVQNAFSAPKALQKYLIAQIRKDGIREYNLKELQKPNPKLCRERRKAGQDIEDVINDILMCSNCCGFYGKQSFHRHKKSCFVDGEPSQAISVQHIENSILKDLDPDFLKDVIGSLRTDKLGNFVRDNKILLQVGCFLYEKVKRKPDKKAEVIRAIRADLRKMAQLYQHFLEQENIVLISNDIKDMFRGNNVLQLRRAINAYTCGEDESSFNAGLKHSLLYLIKTFCRVIKGFSLISNKKEDKDAIDDFLTIFELFKDDIFGDALYKLNTQIQVNLRKPNTLPLEDDIRKLRRHILRAIKNIVNSPFEFLSTSEYRTLRNCVCARLTLYNARRANEPASLTLQQVRDGLAGTWLSDESKRKLEDPNIKFLQYSKLKVTYQIGKGGKDVPVLFPEDCLAALELLQNQPTRDDIGLNKKNLFLFASSNKSLKHIEGWYAIEKSCKDAEIVNYTRRITATSIRKYVCTVYATLELPAAERDLFYKHMGHSKEMNENVYQVPIALREITGVGKNLNLIDQGLENESIQAAGNGDDTHGNGDDTHGNGDNAHGNGDDTYGNGDDTHGSGDDTHGNGDDTHGNGDDTHGNAFEVGNTIEKSTPSRNLQLFLSETPLNCKSGECSTSGNSEIKKGTKRTKRVLVTHSDSFSSEDSDEDTFIERKYPLRNKTDKKKKTKFDIPEEESERSSSSDSIDEDSDGSDSNDQEFDIQKFKNSLEEEPRSTSRCKKRVKNDFPGFLEKQRKRWCQQQSEETTSDAGAVAEKHRWTPKRKAALVKRFGEYIGGEKSHTFPPRENMERFVKEWQLDIPVNRVKEKIMNEKARIKREYKSRKEALGMGHLE